MLGTENSVKSSAELILCGPNVCGQEFPFLRQILEDGCQCESCVRLKEKKSYNGSQWLMMEMLPRLGLPGC